MLVKGFRDLGVGVSLGILTLVVLEGLMRLFGVATPVAEEQLSRGFDRDAEYFLPAPDQPEGTWLTQFWSLADNKAAVIPPKGERERLLLFGGSNTEGFGTRFLREALAAAGSPARYELFNLGRSGFGSERVSIIFEQALERLDPEVVVIYSGHNEFVEAGFRQDLVTQWPNEGVRLAASYALETHLFQVLRTLLGTGPVAGAARHSSAPEDWKSEHDKFFALTLPETMAVLRDYQANLEHMLRAAEARGVRVVLSTVVYNRFSPPSSSTLGAELGPEEAERVRDLMDRAEALLPAGLAPVCPRLDSARVRNTDWDQGWREGEQAGRPRAEPKGAVPGQRPFTGPLADADPLFPAREYWNPKVIALLDSLAVLNARQPYAEDRVLAERQLELLQAVLELEPDHPRALYLRGILRYWLGVDEALVRGPRRRRCLRSRTAPRQPPEQWSGRRSCRPSPGCLFFDADRLWRERHPMQLVGWEWMVDECHVGFGARRLLMRDLANALLARWGATRE